MPRASIACEEQARMAELAPGEEGSRADALVDLRRVLEVPGRLCDAVERGGQQPEVARDRPPAREARAHDAEAIGVRQQQLVEPRRARAVVQLGGHGGEQTRVDQPAPVAGQLEAVLRERAEIAPCLGRAARLAPREDAVTAQQHRGRRVRPGPGGADGGLELSRMNLEDGHLNGVAQGGLDLGLALAELECAPRVLLALGEAAVHDCPRRPPHRQIRQIARLAQLAGDLRPGFDLAVRGHHVALLEEPDDAKPAAEERELAVGRPLAEAHDLVGDREALLGRLRSPKGYPARTEHGGEIPRVAELPCERDRLLAEHQDPLGFRRPIEVDRQAREEPRTKPRIAVAEAIERLLEELDAGLVDDPAPHPEQTRALPGEDERAAGQERRVSDPSRDLGGLAERLTRLRPIAYAPVQSCPFGGTQPLVDGFPDQRVGEPVPPRRARVADEDLAPQGRPEDLEQRIGSEPARALQSPESELASDDRREREGVLAWRGQGGETAADRLSHALRHRKPPRARCVPALEGSFGNQQMHDLVHEEGIAFGLSVDGSHERGGSTAAGLPLDEERYLLFPETAQR